MHFHLYNLDVCPFAQRSKIALIEKGASFEETHIDPRDKPDWFLQMNPKGKLPVLMHEGNLVRESAVVLEYLEDVLPEPALMPPTPYGRSQVRLWLQFFNTEYVPAFYHALLSQEADRKDRMLAMLRELASAFAELDSSGPYFMGRRLTLLDISVVPFIARHPAVEALADCPIPESDELAPLRRWYGAMQQRPSFQRTRRDADFWVHTYREYAQGRWGRTYFEANPGAD